MLRRLREELRVFLHPRLVVMLRVSRGLNKRVTHKRILPCAETMGVPLGEESITVLKSAVHDAPWRGMNTQVVLSNHFVRYALVPWSEQLANRQEREAYLRHCFGAAYGETAKRWDLRMSEPNPDEPSLASGIDQALLESLRSALNSGDIRSDAIHPHLMVGANRSRRWISQGLVWFVMVERGRVCLSLLDRGLWKIVRNHQADADEPAALMSELGTLLAREAILAGDMRQDWPVVLYWPESSMLPSLPGRKVIRAQGRPMEGFDSGDDKAYQLAMWA